MGNILSCRGKRLGKDTKLVFTSQDKAILDLKIQRDRLLQYQKKIELVLVRETELAKQTLQAGNKNKALLFLKKKKYQEKLLEQTDTQLLNLEQLTNSIEYALVEKELLEGIQKGNQVLNAIHKEVSLDDVERLMQDTADAIAYQNEIEKMLGGALSDINDDDLLEDLQLVIDQQLLDSGLEKPIKKSPSISVQETATSATPQALETRVPKTKVQEEPLPA
jgi:charged multivesicular body protein 6